MFVSCSGGWAPGTDPNQGWLWAFPPPPHDGSDENAISKASHDEDISQSLDEETDVGLLFSWWGQLIRDRPLRSLVAMRVCMLRC